MAELITTGVDRLVQLIMQKKRISIDEAAKELSVPKVLIEEWADFLEEREVIGIDYQLAKPYLVYKEMSKQETNEVAKQFEGRKEGFLRRVDSVLQSLDQESDGIRRLKSQFEEMTKDLELKLGHVKGELQTLEHYEALKKEVDTCIADEEKKFEQKKDNAAKQVEMHKNAINRYLTFIEKTERKLSSEEIAARKIMESEALLERRLLEQASALQKKVEGDKGMIAGVMQKIGEFTELSKRLQADLERQKSCIAPLVNESRVYEQNIADIRQKFLKNVTVANQNLNLSLSTDEVKKVKEGFQRVFEKKDYAEKLINKLNSDLVDLKKEFHELSNEAMVVKLSTKSKKVADYVKNFEEKFNSLDTRKENFKKEVNDLSSVFKKL
jgi:chromosome segregation ATPase